MAVGHQRAAGAEAARNGRLGPGAERDLLDLVELLDRQIRIPEPAFLGGRSASWMVDSTQSLSQDGTLAS